MRAGVLGGSSQERSLPFNAERTINLFPTLDKQGKEPGSLLGTPGLSMFGQAGAGPGRGGFASTNGRVFEISGAGLYEINSDGTTVLRGTLDTAAPIVTCDENTTQLAVCDGTSLYIFTYATNAFVKVVTANLPSAASVTYLDGYFIVNRVNSGIFQISAIQNGLTWAALDFATAESSPDGLLRVLNIVGQLWLFGTKTVEIWTNTGAVAFPFSKISGAKMETGILAAYSAIPLDNSAFWIGRDNNGAGIVYRATGFTPQRISTQFEERKIQAAPSPNTLRGYSYQEDGHTFYVVTGGGMETSLVYDLSTQLWHERAYLNEQGILELHIAAYVVYGFNKQLAFDRRNGKIYVQSLDSYSDNGDEIARERIFTHVFDENKRFVISNLTVGFDTGVGLQTGQGSDPQAILYVSRDGGMTYSGGQQAPIGKVGKYKDRVIWRRLGQQRQATFKVRITDPVPVRITGAFFNNA